MDRTLSTTYPLETAADGRLGGRGGHKNTQSVAGNLSPTSSSRVFDGCCLEEEEQYFEVLLVYRSLDRVEQLFLL